jgi:hypothetical protein
MVDRQCPGGFSYKRYKRNAALNAAFFLVFTGREPSALYVGMKLRWQ